MFEYIGNVISVFPYLVFFHLFVPALDVRDHCRAETVKRQDSPGHSSNVDTSGVIGEWNFLKLG